MYIEFTEEELQAIKHILSLTLQPGNLELAAAVVELVRKIDNAPRNIMAFKEKLAQVQSNTEESGVI